MSQQLLRLAENNTATYKLTVLQLQEMINQAKIEAGAPVPAIRHKTLLFEHEYLLT